MAKVGVAGARSRNEVVIGNLLVGELHHPPLQIEVHHFSQQHFDVAVAANDPADGSGDLRRRQPRGGHLVEQGLKRMVVLTVNDRDPDRVFGQVPGGVQAAKSTAHNHNVRCVLVLHGLGKASM